VQASRLRVEDSGDSSTSIRISATISKPREAKPSVCADVRLAELEPLPHGYQDGKRRAIRDGLVAEETEFTPPLQVVGAEALPVPSTTLLSSSSVAAHYWQQGGCERGQREFAPGRLELDSLQCFNERDITSE
jgi:hypothetical protein